MRTREALTLNGGDSLNRGLVGFWPFNEASGPVVSDLSRFRRPGLITNTSTSRIFQPPGRVISLDGTDDFVSIPQQNFPIGNQPYTFSGWVYWAASGSTSGSTKKIMTWGGTGTTRSGVYIGIESNRFNVSHWAEDWTSGVFVPVAEWFHFAITYDGTQDKVWLNGTFREAKTLGGALVVNTSGNNANAGRLINLNIEYFNGYFSNFRVWNRTLQPDEISRLYADPWAGTLTPGPRLYSASSLITGTIADTIGITGALSGVVLEPITGTLTDTVDITGSLIGGSGSLGGRLRRRGRYRVWDDVPPEIQPVVSLAENYADAYAVERAVDEAIARMGRLRANASAAKRRALIEDVSRSIVRAVEAAAEADDEEALIALM